MKWDQKETHGSRQGGLTLYLQLIHKGLVKYKELVQLLRILIVTLQLFFFSRKKLNCIYFIYLQNATAMALYYVINSLTQNKILIGTYYIVGKTI